MHSRTGRKNSTRLQSWITERHLSCLRWRSREFSSFVLLGRTPPGDYQAAVEQISDVPHSKKFVQNALENCRANPNMFQSWILEKNLSCLRWGSTDFGSLTSRVMNKGLENTPPGNHRARLEQIPHEPHSERLVLKALENRREELNQVAIEYHRHWF